MITQVCHYNDRVDLDNVTLRHNVVELYGCRRVYRETRRTERKRLFTDPISCKGPCPQFVSIPPSILHHRSEWVGGGRIKYVTTWALYCYKYCFALCSGSWLSYALRSNTHSRYNSYKITSRNKKSKPGCLISDWFVVWYRCFTMDTNNKKSLIAIIQFRILQPRPSPSTIHSTWSAIF